MITWPAALIAGAVVLVGALLYVGNFGDRMADWHGAGLRIGPLSGDQTTATLRFADPASLQRALSSSPTTAD